jgi:TRAP-type uncharacterized transport system substrate-binding protein
MRKLVATFIITAFVASGGAATALYFYNRPTVLRVATPQTTEEQKLLSAAAQSFAREHESVRLKIVPVADSAAAAAALKLGSVDVAVIRADVGLPPGAQALVILHRNAALLLAPPGSKLKRISDLRGKKIGVVHEAPTMNVNAHLLELILAQYDIAPGAVTLTPLEPVEVRGAVGRGRVDAVFYAMAPQKGLANDIVGAVAGPGGKPPVFIPVTEGKAIAKRVPTLEPLEIVQGAFGGDPPRPAEAFDSVAASTALFAPNTMKDALAAELTRLFFSHRGDIAVAAPLANSIEAPSTDKGAALPVHQGAADYLDGNERSFFDKYSDFFYVGAMLLSLLGSAAAALSSRFNRYTHERAEQLTERLLEILQQARLAQSLSELDEFEREVDEVLVQTLADRRLHSVDGPGLHIVTLALDQVRRAINERRLTLSNGGQLARFLAPSDTAAESDATTENDAPTRAEQAE